MPKIKRKPQKPRYSQTQVEAMEATTPEQLTSRPYVHGSTRKMLEGSEVREVESDFIQFQDHLPPCLTFLQDELLQAVEMYQVAKLEAEALKGGQFTPRMDGGSVSAEIYTTEAFSDYSALRGALSVSQRLLIDRALEAGQRCILYSQAQQEEIERGAAKLANALGLCSDW